MDHAVPEAELRVWGHPVTLRGFLRAEIDEIADTFAGAVDEVGPATASDAPLLLERCEDADPRRAVSRRPRHRGGSSARKFFLDGELYQAEEQHRDIGVVAQEADVAVYEEDGAVLEARPESAVLHSPTRAPSMLCADIVEDWLLTRIRCEAAAVQVHCAAWLEDGRAVLVVGDSGVGKTTSLFGAVKRGAGFLSNDRAFLRPTPGGGVEVRGFPLPVNVGCGTIRSLGLDLPDHGLGDHDKIRLRPAQVAERFDVDFEAWYPVAAVLADDADQLDRNVYWDEDECHPFWVRPWYPGAFPAAARAELAGALSGLLRRHARLTT